LYAKGDAFLQISSDFEIFLKNSLEVCVMGETLYNKHMKNQKKIDKFIYWTPRTLGIFFVLFLMLFSLDVFEPGLTVWQIAVGLFMHNIPALFLLIILIISWKREIVGGVVFILAGIVLFRSLILAGPAFLIGALFLLNWFKK
jgi:hypothetical protein